MLKLSLTVGIARGYAEHLNGLLGFELSFDCRDSGVLNMCLLIDNIQKAIATAQSRYYKLVLAIPGTLLDPEQASAISVQDPGEQAPHTPPLQSFRKWFFAALICNRKSVCYVFQQV